MSTAERTLIEHARVVSDGHIEPESWILLEGSRIEASGWGDAPSGDFARVDAGGAWATPGFIDLHCHGAGGFAFDDGAEAISAARAVHRSHGTTRSVLSLVTAPLGLMAQRLETIAALCERDETLLGAHLEGPFLSVGHRGAHDPALLQDPAPEAVARLLDAGRGHIAQVTLAPERPGALEAIGQFVQAGVRVAVGHTTAGYEEASAAFDRGATILTHAFNGMDDMLHRKPGPLPAAVERSGVTVELICDGVHVSEPAMRVLMRAARGRMALITDAMAAAGSSDGSYLLGALAVDVVDGVARLHEGGSIAGSTLLLDAAFRRAVFDLGVAVPEAVAMLTATPARTLGVQDRLGRLAPGFAADVLLWDEGLHLLRGWAAGQEFSAA